MHIDKKDERQKQIFTNEKIRCRNARVIDDSMGRQLGIMPTQQAIAIAKSKNLDLMQVGFHNGIAICKICDYGKFMYMQKQRLKDAKRKAKAAIQDVKELYFSLCIDTGDLNTKIRHAKEFLADNCKVKLAVKFSKREMAHFDLGKDVIKSVLKELDGIAELDSLPRAEGRQLFCVVRPKKQ